MFIRFHFFFYAIGCLLVILARYFHCLFYFLLILYLIWLYKRFSFQYLLICCLFCSLFLFYPNDIKKQPNTYIEGTVEKIGDGYCYVKTDFGLMKLYHNAQLEYKDDIQAIVEYQTMNTASNDHAFDEQLYLYGQNVFYKANMTKLIIQEHHDTLYHFIEKRLSTDEDINSYQRLLLLGERNEDIQDDYQQLSQNSLVHLFALSGMHIHILYHLLFSAFGLLFQKRYAKILSYGCIGYYVFSIPMQISLYRAFFVLILYDLLKNYFNQLDVLSLLIIISLFYNPYIIYNISFVFSYFIYFIVLLTKNDKHSFIYIYLSTIPIVLNINYQIPIFSIFIGMYLMPFIEIFYTLCIFSIFFSFGELFLMFGVYSLKKIILFLDAFNTLLVFSKPNLLFIFLYYIIYFCILYRKSLKKNINQNILMMISLMLSFSFYSEYKIYGEITMIDVGQGDCTLIRLPFNQGNILIDTGGNQSYDLATKTIIPYLKSIGVRQLDYVYISHDDYDHCGALDSLVENFPVKHIIREYEAYRKIGCIEIDMLEHDYSQDTNDQSLVMYVKFPSFCVLFTGDISTTVEKELIEKYDQLDVDILKVSHHGSNTATSPELFEWIHPSVAMIGVKKNNIYHHPSENVVQRLKRKNITILRTDEDGMFHIRFYFRENYMIYR